MRILIIEDEKEQAENLKEILELKGFAVDWVDEVEKAQSRLSLYRSEYSVVLLDLSIKGGDGMELLKSARADGVMTPIIILTGRSETKWKIELLQAGADDYVVKPYSSQELIARINSVVRRPAVLKPVVYTVGDLEFDTSTRSVRVGGSEVPLTLKEYSLLECFVRQPNEVLKREDLCNQLWDFNSVSWSNVLDVHMKNLRKKLHHGKHSIRLETIRGIGYRLAV